MDGPGDSDVVIDQRELGVVVEVRNVFGSSSGEIVNRYDFITTGK
jgi:hypothetical protein